MVAGAVFNPLDLGFLPEAFVIIDDIIHMKFGTQLNMLFFILGCTSNSLNFRGLVFLFMNMEDSNFHIHYVLIESCKTNL